jgi:hypothetical protein
MDEVLLMLKKIQDDMATNKQDMDERLGKLEEEQAKAVPEQENSETETKPQITERVVTEIASAKEKQLSKFFGVDTSATALLEFLDHYRLCVEINQAKKVPGWGDPDYRAKELRFQLQGEVAIYVRQEETMGQDWVNDDKKIIEKLKERWLNRDCIELDIIEFEEARQGEYETLAQFMQRLKGLGQRAFSEFDPNGMHQRIIWRFLDGVKEKDIRSEIIRARWMKDRKTPKPYDEVLKIAENAKMIKVAAGATGHNGHGSGSSKSNAIQVAAMVPHGRKNVRGTPPSRPRAFDCFYCRQRHPGGWRTCEKRKRENPDWEPTSSGYGSGRSSGGASSTSGSNPTSPTSTAGHYFR